MYCTKCGTEAKESDAFCANCGNPLRQPSRDNAPESRAELRAAGAGLLAAKKELAMTMARAAAAQPGTADSATWFRTAVEKLTEVVSEVPNDAEAWSAIGTCYFGLGEPENAIPPLEAATRIDPSLSEAWGFLGSSYDAAGRDEDAIRAFSETLRLNPQDSAAWIQMGGVLLDRGEFERAAQAAKEALRLGPPSGASFLPGPSFESVCKELLDEATKGSRQR